MRALLTRTTTFLLLALALVLPGWRLAQAPHEPTQFNFLGSYGENDRRRGIGKETLGLPQHDEPRGF